MSHQYVHVIIPKEKVDDVIAAADRDGVTLSGVTAVKGPGRTVLFLATLKAQQDFVDALQKTLSKTEDWQIVISPVDAVVTPRPAKDEEERHEVTETREELLSQLSRNANLTPSFLTLVAISAVVAGLGMIESNVAAIIGAMVIAPLLGPLLGSILGVTLGERALVLKGVQASVAGIALAVAVGAVLGLVLPVDLAAHELAARAQVGFGELAMALAAGTAAALSLTAGVASVLVGVMVAVALMPPATAIGVFLGNGAWSMAGEAGLLLAVNMVAVHLSGQVVFLVRGVKPRTRYRQAKVRLAIRSSIAVSVGLLVALAVLIWFQGDVPSQLK